MEMTNNPPDNVNSDSEPSANAPDNNRDDPKSSTPSRSLSSSLSLYGRNEIVDRVSADIDRFIESLSSANDKPNSKTPDIPDAVDTFTKIIDSRMTKYCSSAQRSKFGQMTEDGSFFLQAVTRLTKLNNAFEALDIPSGSKTAASTSIQRTKAVLERAMAFLKDQFRALLDGQIENLDPVHSNIKHLRSQTQSSFEYSGSQESDRRLMLNDDSAGDGEEDFQAHSSAVVNMANRIATAMILAGYATDCSHVYSISRRNAFDEQMRKRGFDKINVDDVQRMNWESLEEEITKWIQIVKFCSGVLFPGERKLVESVFSDNPMISRGLFANLARAVVVRHMYFADAVATTRRSAEKLFKLLDMCEALQNLVQAIDASCVEESCHDLKSEIYATSDCLGKAAANIFSDLETSIRSDSGKTPLPGGAVHPLTRYVLNYLKYAGEYKETLEHVYRRQQENLDTPSEENSEDDQATTPFAVQLQGIMDLLDANLEAKAGLYRDVSLRCIFLMNNGRYILQKVKGSCELHQLMGDTWYRRKSTVVRHFHKNYQRETWGRVLQCLSHEGLQVHGKVNKMVLKDRFRNFNAMFEEIQRTQSTWVVNDEQLQSELQVSISAVVIPAYRSFLGRFKQYFEGGRQAERYLKYQTEDIESLIEGLFAGNSSSMNRRRH